MCLNLNLVSKETAAILAAFGGMTYGMANVFYGAFTRNGDMLMAGAALTATSASFIFNMNDLPFLGIAFTLFFLLAGPFLIAAIMPGLIFQIPVFILAVLLNYWLVNLAKKHDLQIRFEN